MSQSLLKPEQHLREERDLVAWGLEIGYVYGDFRTENLYGSVEQTRVDVNDVCGTEDGWRVLHHATAARYSASQVAPLSRGAGRGLQSFLAIFGIVPCEVSSYWCLVFSYEVSSVLNEVSSVLSEVSTLFRRTSKSNQKRLETCRRKRLET